MCGGVREFESLRAPPSTQVDVSLQHQGKIQHYELAAKDMYYSHTERFMKAVNITNRDQTMKKRHDAAPAGLAIVAAMGSELNESASATTPVCGPVTKLQSLSTQSVQLQPAPASADVKPAGKPQSKAAGLPGRYGSSVPMSRCRKVREEEKLSSRKSSIFFPAVSPPDDDNYEQVEVSMGTRPSADFMGACFLCQRPLGSGIDIFIYRGDRAFCSNECRYQHIVDDDRLQHQILITNYEPAHCTDRATASRPSPIIRVLG